MSDAAEEFAYLLSVCGADLPLPVREYRFCERRYRFDFAWPLARVALEVNGGRYAFAGGRHASDADHEKLRRACALGWRVLPVSPQAMRAHPGEVIADLREALEWTP
jgi:very-short-patch-repair endonuclease